MKSLTDRWKAFRQWWRGSYQVDDDGEVVFLHLERPEVARRTDALLAWCAKHGWNLTFVVIGLIGLVLGWLAIK